MAEVTLSVAGRSYAIAAREGDEPHLRHLESLLQRHAADALRARARIAIARLEWPRSVAAQTQRLLVGAGARTALVEAALLVALLLERLALIGSRSERALVMGLPVEGLVREGALVMGLLLERLFLEAAAAAERLPSLVVWPNLSRRSPPIHTTSPRLVPFPTSSG